MRCSIAKTLLLLSKCSSPFVTTWTPNIWKSGGRGRELFAWDIEDDKGCEIDLEPNRCDEMVDWAVNEPVVFPQCLPESCEYSFGNFGWGWGR